MLKFSLVQENMEKIEIFSLILKLGNRSLSIGKSNVWLDMIKSKLIISFSQLDAVINVLKVWPKYSEH